MQIQLETKSDVVLSQPDTVAHLIELQNPLFLKCQTTICQQNPMPLDINNCKYVNSMNLNVVLNRGSSQPPSLSSDSDIKVNPPKSCKQNRVPRES